MTHTFIDPKITVFAQIPLITVIVEVSVLLCLL